MRWSDSSGGCDDRLGLRVEGVAEDEESAAENHVILNLVAANGLRLRSSSRSMAGGDVR